MTLLCVYFINTYIYVFLCTGKTTYMSKSSLVPRPHPLVRKRVLWLLRASLVVPSQLSHVTYSYWYKFSCDLYKKMCFYNLHTAARLTHWLLYICVILVFVSLNLEQPISRTKIVWLRYTRVFTNELLQAYSAGHSVCLFYTECPLYAWRRSYGTETLHKVMKLCALKDWLTICSRILSYNIPSHELDMWYNASCNLHRLMLNLTWIPFCQMWSFETGHEWYYSRHKHTPHCLLNW